MTDINVIEGIVETIIFSNQENRFFILSVIVNDNRLVVKGSVSTVSVGEIIQAKGEFVTHADYGTQFKASLIENLTWKSMLEGNPSVQGAISFLSSNLIKGVSKAQAVKIVNILGADAIGIISNNPHCLDGIKGIKNPDNICAQVKVNYCQAVLHTLLAPYGVTPKMIVRTYEKFGSDALQIIKNNPYQLCKVDGIGFEKADKYAIKMGIEHDSPYRAREGVKFALYDITMSLGSCGIEENELLLTSKELLGVPEDLILNTIEGLCASGDIKYENGYYFDIHAYHAENNIARHIKRLSGKTSFNEIKIIKAIIDAEKIVGKTLSILQREAAIMAIQNKFCIITGQPGTGKTTIVQVIICALSLLGINENDVAVVAPTGKAGKRLKETCGKGATIHLTLGATGDGKFERNEENPLYEKLVVSDEFSMCDIFLANNLFSAIQTGSTVIIIGDNDQLKSVGPGSVLGDMIFSGTIPVIRLTELRRFDGDIAIASKMVNEGIVPSEVSGKKDFFLIGATQINAMNGLTKIVLRMLEMGEIPDNIQVLVPMKAGEISVKSANNILQPILNKNITVNSSFFTRFDVKYYEGDRVMQLKNDSQNKIFNGDVGIVTEITQDGIKVKFDSNELFYKGFELDEITLCYAATIHKMQGSECSNIIMMMFMCHYHMLRRNLLYTGMTRAKKRLVVITDKARNGVFQTLQKAVSVVDSELRITRLGVLLRNMLPQLE